MASEVREFVSVILVQLAESLKQLSADEWAAVRNGSFRIAVSSADVAKKARSSVALPEPDEFVQHIVDRLECASEREAGLKILKERGTTKNVLRAVARVIGVPAPAKDSKDILTQRIVESTIGFRLRSQAIQGPN